MSNNQSTSDAETTAARRLGEALEPSAIIVKGTVSDARPPSPDTISTTNVMLG